MIEAATVAFPHLLAVRHGCDANSVFISLFDLIALLKRFLKLIVLLGHKLSCKALLLIDTHLLTDGAC